MSSQYYQAKWMHHQYQMQLAHEQQMALSDSQQIHSSLATPATMYQDMPHIPQVPFQGHGYNIPQQPAHLQHQHIVYPHHYPSLQYAMELNCSLPQMTTTSQTNPLYAFSAPHQPTPFSCASMEQLPPQCQVVEPEQAHLPPTRSVSPESRRLPCAFLERALAVSQGSSNQQQATQPIVTYYIPNDLGSEPYQIHPGLQAQPEYNYEQCAQPWNTSPVHQSTSSEHNYTPNRLSHESWYLSQPYHIGLPQTKHPHLADRSFGNILPSSDTATPHQVVCPIHNRVFDSSLYPMPPIGQEPRLPTIADYMTHAATDHAPSVSAEQYLPVVPTPHYPQENTHTSPSSGSSGLTCSTIASIATTDTGVKCATSSKNKSSKKSVAKTSNSGDVPSVQVSPASTKATTSATADGSKDKIPWPLPPSPVSAQYFTASEEATLATREQDCVVRSHMFAENFMRIRLEQGFTPEGIAQQVNIRFSSMVNPPLCGMTVSLFECGSLPPWEMLKIQNYLENWLVDTERARGVPLQLAKELSRNVLTRDQRKKRTYIDDYQRFILEQEFLKNNKPNRQELQEIVKKIGGNGLVDIETVRVWFSNRRTRSKLPADDPQE